MKIIELGEIETMEEAMNKINKELKMNELREIEFLFSIKNQKNSLPKTNNYYICPYKKCTITRFDDNKIHCAIEWDEK